MAPLPWDDSGNRMLLYLPIFQRNRRRIKNWKGIFEDDEYFYYVKAVPKIKVTQKDRNVTDIKSGENEDDILFDDITEETDLFDGNREEAEKEWKGWITDYAVNKYRTISQSNRKVFILAVSAIYWIYRYFGDNHYQCDCLSDVEVGTADSGMDVI